MAHRKSRRNNGARKSRKNTRRNYRRNNMRRMMYGGQSSPGSVAMNEMTEMQQQSLAQGRQFESYHVNQHGGQNNLPPTPVGNMQAPTPNMPATVALPAAVAGAAAPAAMSGGKSRRNRRRAAKRGGALDGAPFPGAVEAPYILPEALRASARMLPLDNDYNVIKNLRDQDGGRRNRKASRKSKKNTRKGRKGRKASRKASTSRKNRKYVKRGGSYDLAMASPYGAPTMLLSAAQEAKALGGMNSEWKLAENPMAFAPGYTK